MARRRNSLAIPLALFVAAPGLYLSGCGPAKRLPNTRPYGQPILRYTPLASPQAQPNWTSVKPLLIACAKCHVSGGVAQGGLVFTSTTLNTTPADDVADYLAVLLHVNTALPADSPLLFKGCGRPAPFGSGLVPHAAGDQLGDGSLSDVLLTLWISKGAPFR